jgi:hypothetical protein
MARMADSHIEELLSKYSATLLESVSTLECKGIFRMFFPNFFTFIQVQDEFTTIATQLLSSCGFEESALMESSNSPRTHISIMNRFEQRRVSRQRAYQVLRRWRDCEVTFQIEKVQMWVHLSKETGEQRLNCCFKVKSATIEAIRVDLGWEPENIHYNMHMSVSEKYLK